MAENTRPRGRPKGSGPPRGNVLALKGSPEWKAWLDAFADHCRLKLADTVDQALAAYAEHRGFRPPPKR
jgi:hypothetical protein